MHLKSLLHIFLIITIFYISVSSARKSGRDKKNEKSATTEVSEIQSKDGDKNQDISSELQLLKGKVQNLTTEASVVKVKKPKHRRKNKHHSRGSQRTRPRKKNRTRPTDILTAVDEITLPKSALSETKLKEETSGEVRKERRISNKNSKKIINRDLDETEESILKLTNDGGYSSHTQRQHRRRRFHHKKHTKSSIPTKESTLKSPVLVED